MMYLDRLAGPKRDDLVYFPLSSSFIKHRP